MNNCIECTSKDWEISEHLISTLVGAKKAATVLNFVFGEGQIYETNKINTIIYTCKHCGYMKLFKKDYMSS